MKNKLNALKCRIPFLLKKERARTSYSAIELQKETNILEFNCRNLPKTLALLDALIDKKKL